MLISFEGIDGCGKSTQINKLREFFIKKNYNVHVFREPGGTQLSEQIRKILLNSREEIHPLAETLLFSAARAQLVETRIRPLLAVDAVVILDRFFDSTTAYQGYGRQAIPVEDIAQLNILTTQNLVPDITFYLKLDYKKASERRKISGEEDRMEQSGVEFFKRVSAGYDQIASQEERIVTLDASMSPEEIFHAILDHIRKKQTFS
ncbi:MAG: dTMP kinase [Balneolales bacterium]